MLLRTDLQDSELTSMPAFNVSRSTQIESDPETVFKTFSDFATWERWSPWLLAEKDATVTLKGDPTRVGGGFSWDGSVVGAGEMEHLELHPPSSGNSPGTMHAQLRFVRPWKSESKVDFEVKAGKDAEGRDVTNVRWDMAGSLPLVMFWMKNLMISLISMDYDRGLRMAKELIETGEIASETIVHGVTQVPSQRFVGLSGKTTLAEIGPAMEKTMGEVKKRIAEAGIATDGQWLSIYDDMNIKKQTLSYTSGMKLPEGASTPSGLSMTSVGAFTAMHVTHVGRYEHMGNAWFAAYQNLQAMKRKMASKLPGVEVYANSPEDTPPQELRTELYVPLK